MKRREAIKSLTLTTGMVVSSSAIISLLQSCKGKDPLTWTPAFLTGEEAYVIEKMADVILPKGDSIGALDVDVQIFLDSLINECYSPKQQEKFRKGITVYINRFQESIGSLFSEANDEKKERFINETYAAYNDRSKDVYDLVNTGKPEPGAEDEYYFMKFLITVRDITINTFFSSEKVSKEMLRYVTIPGQYKGCIDYNGTDPVFAQN